VALNSIRATAGPRIVSVSLEQASTTELVEGKVRVGNQCVLQPCAGGQDILICSTF
jgi:hypothetical protein